MFNKFPREVGPPRKVVYNIQDWLKFVNTYNGKKKAVYTSIYIFNNIKDNGKPDYKTAIIDNLFFDFDDKSCNAYEECKKLHNFLKKENIKHFMVMSGRGYHLYISTSPLSSNNSKSCIYNAQYNFIDKLKLNVDTQVVGNPAQLARVPNTYNTKGKRFCIPITEIQFNGGDKAIKKLAKHQNFVTDIVIGKELFNISKFDFVSDKFEGEIDLNINDFEDNSSCSYMEDLPTSIKALLRRRNLGWNERYLVIMYFKEKGYTRQEVYNILKQHLSERKFKHCIMEERQLQYLFERDDLMFPETHDCKIYK